MSVAAEAGDPDVVPDRQRESFRVAAQVTGKLLPGRVGPRGSRVAAAGKGVVPGRGEQPEGVPAAAPAVPGTGVLIQDDVGALEAGQVVAHGQTRLAAADDDRIEVL